MHANRQGDERSYVKHIRHWLESTQGRPSAGRRAIVDADGIASLRRLQMLCDMREGDRYYMRGPEMWRSCCSRGSVNAHDAAQVARGCWHFAIATLVAGGCSTGTS
ncbi:MAG: hypothetical protein WKF96_01545 [Solirubrobacteraceae bacterium]